MCGYVGSFLCFCQVLPSIPNNQKLHILKDGTEEEDRKARGKTERLASPPVPALQPCCPNYTTLAMLAAA